jgi:hypothetical protein
MKITSQLQQANLLNVSLIDIRAVQQQDVYVLNQTVLSSTNQKTADKYLYTITNDNTLISKRLVVYG